MKTTAMNSTLTEMLAASRRDQFLADAEAHRRSARARPRPVRPNISPRSLRAVMARARAGADRPFHPARAA